MRCGEIWITCPLVTFGSKRWITTADEQEIIRGSKEGYGDR